MEEQGINDSQQRATEIQSGATPLAETELPLHVPKQTDYLQGLHLPASSAPWTYAELLSQPKRISTIEITTSTSQNAAIWSFDHTFDNVAGLHFPHRKNDFRNYSWTLHFRLQFRSNFQQVGQIVVAQHNIPKNVFSYLSMQAYPKYIDNNYAALTMLPHTKVPMGEDTDVTIEMPWNIPAAGTYSCMANYYYVANDGGEVKFMGPELGSLLVYAPWQMQVATGVNPNLTMEVWSWLTDLKLGGYDPRKGLL